MIPLSVDPLLEVTSSPHQLHRNNMIGPLNEWTASLKSRLSLMRNNKLPGAGRRPSFPLRSSFLSFFFYNEHHFLVHWSITKQQLLSRSQRRPTAGRTKAKCWAEREREQVAWQDRGWVLGEREWVGSKTGDGAVFKSGGQAWACWGSVAHWEEGEGE